MNKFWWLFQVFLLLTLSIYLFIGSLFNFTFFIQKLFANLFPKPVDLIKVSNKNTAWKVSKCGCFPGPSFPISDWIRIFILSRHTKYEKIRTVNSIFGHFSRSESLSVLSLLTLIMLLNNKRIFSQAFSEAVAERCSKSRSSHQRCSMSKGVLRNLTKFTGKHLYNSL